MTVARDPHTRKLGWPVGYIGLAALFLAVDAYYIYVAFHFGPGIDAHIYYRGAEAYVTGENPWSASYQGHTFAAAPSTVLLLAPATMIPEDVFAAAAVAGSAVIAFVTIRRLGLWPGYLLFPPLVQGTLNGNPVVLMLALLVLGPKWLSVPVKLHAIVPLLLAGPRSSLIFGAFSSLLIGFWLWPMYLSSGAPARLELESGGGLDAIGTPLLVPAVAALVFLLVRDRPVAAWLAVPALTPSSGFYNAALGLPVIRPWMAAVLALPIPGAPAIALITAAFMRVLQDRSPITFNRSP